MTVVGQTKFTKLAMVNVSSGKKSRVWARVPDGSTLIFGDIQVLL